MSFQVGDRVAYPMHGAGVIESIEETEILGDRCKYYVMRMVIGDMKLMIPMDKAIQVGLRNVLDKGEFAEIFSKLEFCPETQAERTGSWNHRQRANQERMKCGSVQDMVWVILALTLREREKGLSTGERKMLDNAKQILVSELVLAEDLEREQAFELIHDMVATADCCEVKSSQPS